MSRTMKALSIDAPGQAVIRDVPLPPADGNMVLIKVMRTGICATDMAIYSGDCSFVRSGEITYPVRIGHEYCGVVEAVGPAVTEFKPGDRVYSDCAATCGVCPACQRHDYMNCVDIRSLGTVHAWDGAYAEYMQMPEHNVFHLPDNVSFDEGALIEPLAIAFDTFRGIKLTANDAVAVVGSGPIGMCAVWLARALGAGKVILIGRNENKLAIGKAIGATDVINSRKCDAQSAVKSLTGGKGVDLFIEAAGVRETLLLGIDCTRRDGVISIASFFERNLDDLPIDKLVLSCLTLRGAAGRFGNPPAACKILQESAIRLSPIITHHIRLEDCPEYFANAGKYQNERIKVMIDFGEK